MYANEQSIEPTSLGHLPEGRWVFDESVTAVFGDMLARSIPQYKVMRSTVFDMGVTYVQPESHIVDLGCSRGDGLAPFVDALGSSNRYLAMDVSQPMLAAARQRFRKEIERGVLAVSELDLRTSYPAVQASLTLCVLTLQFTPIEHRQRIVQDVFDSTLPGGALILVEKILGSTARINNQMVELYYAYKRSSGYTLLEIERKKRSLEGVLVPVTARWNEELLTGAGFKQVDCFWRWMNFAGWVAIK